MTVLLVILLPKDRIDMFLANPAKIVCSHLYVSKHSLLRSRISLTAYMCVIVASPFLSVRSRPVVLQAVLCFATPALQPTGKFVHKVPSSRPASCSVPCNSSTAAHW